MGILTTTVGWFPKPRALRVARWQLSEGEIELDALRSAEDQATRDVIGLQDRIGLDHLVDGQMERSDLVTYFAEHLDGMEVIGLVRCFVGSRALAERLADTRDQCRARILAIGGIREDHRGTLAHESIERDVRAFPARTEDLGCGRDDLFEAGPELHAIGESLEMEPRTDAGVRRFRGGK